MNPAWKAMYDRHERDLDLARESGAYYETFLMYDAIDDDEDSDDRWHPHWACGICHREIMGPDLDSDVCTDHAPDAIPGLTLAPCGATPRHPRTWFHASDGYPPPCMYCAYDGIAEAHHGCEHARHGAWRAWKITARGVRGLRRVGIITGSTWKGGGGCNGCFTRIVWRWGSG